MAELTYGSLFSDISSKFGQIETQRTEIKKRETTGFRNIEELRRFNPKSSMKFGLERKQKVKDIRSEIGQLSKLKTSLSESEEALKKQEATLKERQSAGWKIRKKAEEIQFFKPAPKQSSGGSAGGGFSVRVKWKTKTGDIRSFVGKSGGSWSK